MDDYHTSGGMAFLFSIITCGIYSWYWCYRMGQKMDGLKGGYHTILFLLLGIFGLGIVDWCIIQDELNHRAA
jgi:UDP-N-acetylmuramyl pentapeptide phosphotransferase/UDP-N-acetylglucosamine-1-phosphate transferase